MRRCGALIARLWAVAVVAVVAGCADQPPAQAGAATPAFRIQGFPDTPPPPTPSNADAAAASERQNDPSAPPDTPLCGNAAREADSAAAAISPGIEASGGACLSTACFDPLTDTFIGADGYRHVCQ